MAVCQMQRPSDPLDHSLIAFCAIQIRLSGADISHDETVQLYNQALSKIIVVLDSPSIGNSDESLAAIVVLSTCEVIQALVQKSPLLLEPRIWRQHITPTAAASFSGLLDLTIDIPSIMADAHNLSRTEYSIAQSIPYIDLLMEKFHQVNNWRALRRVSPDILQDVAQYWDNKYDWSSIEDRLNRQNNHYATSITINGSYEDPVPLHFVHEQSSDPDAIPLILLHGWPSTHLEWSKVIEPLVNHADTPFHVVAPDLPGFGFSPAPTKAGLGPHENAQVMDGLMKQLGYSQYGIVSTDLGWQVAMWLVRDSPASIIGHITDFFSVQVTPDDLNRLAQNQTTKDQEAYLTSNNIWSSTHAAYSTVQSQKPLALSFAFTDSPVGFLGWMWDLMHAISDGYNYSYEELITDAMMLFIPGPYSNIRAYLEAYKPGLQDFSKSDIPTGVTEWSNANGPFPELGSFQSTPRSWIERSTNLVYFTRHSSGGHFPAVSQPKEWVKDVRNFFSELLQKE
ncbi:hypothetical protein ACHAQI_009079 [Fusarium lateritium]